MYILTTTTIVVTWDYHKGALAQKKKPPSKPGGLSDYD